MTIALTFWGAAGQVTGSCHLLEWNGRRVLLDCGLFQGKRIDATRFNAQVAFDPRQLEAVVLSHAHIDHSGRLPLLVSRQFNKPIYATPATRDLCASMLPDSAHIQQSDFKYLKKRNRAGPEAAPLYEAQDAIGAVDLMETHPYERPFTVARDLTVTYRDAGHILGSANVDVQIAAATPHRLVFSGDVGRWGQPIIRDPSGPRGAIDTLIVESTYALKNHDTSTHATDHLAEVVNKVAARKGIVMIPSFALGRTQELIYALHELADANKIPQIPIYIDSPLAVEATAVFRLHPELFDDTETLVRSDSRLFDYHLVTYVRDVNQSKQLNSLNGPAIIIAASGMAENGRITHHLANHCDDPANCILLVGYQGEGTLGRRIQDGQRNVRILGEPHTIRCDVDTIDGYSAHAGRDELLRWVKELGGPIKRAFCVHGEPESLLSMQKMLSEQAGIPEVHVPKHGETFQIG